MSTYTRPTDHLDHLPPDVAAAVVALVDTFRQTPTPEQAVKLRQLFRPVSLPEMRGGSA